MPSLTAALVLFSGGQDSTTCLAWALERFQRVETIGFDYRQRHRVELDCRLVVLRELKARFPRWTPRLGEDHLVSLEALAALGETAMTHDVAIEAQANGLPNTFVPGRNLLFFTLAAALGYRRGIGTLVGGMCETDFSGYPDCRHDTLQALQTAITLGLDEPFVLETPLMRLTKAQTWRLAETLGGAELLKLIVNDTHTCYLGERGSGHDWGRGCGRCPACVLRKNGYREFAGG